MSKIILPSIDEIIEINRRVGGKLLNKGSLEFIITKIESKFMKEEYVTRYIIENGKLRKLRVKKSEAFRDVEFILRQDKNF
jgi:hypothetical protein